MAGRKGRDGVSQKNYFASYATKASKNRAKRLAKHQKNHPNDLQGGGTEYRKSTPKEISGWLTASVDSLLTPVQKTPITTKTASGKRETFIPECAEHLKDMTKADRKIFAELYARMRKVQAHADSFGNPKAK